MFWWLIAWEEGRSAACDFTVISPLNSAFWNDAGMKAGTAAAASKSQKHVSMALVPGTWQGLKFVFPLPLKIGHFPVTALQ